MAVRRFLKEVGVTSQRAIENAVRDGRESGRLKNPKTVHAKMTLHVPELDLSHVVEDDIEIG